MYNKFYKKIVVFLVAVFVSQTLFIHADNSVVVDNKANLDKIYVEEMKIDSLEQLNCFKNGKLKNKFDLLKVGSDEKFVSGVKRTFYVKEVIDTINNKVVDSHLMTNVEVEKYKNKKLMYLSDYDYDIEVGNDIEKEGALTLYLYVTQKSNGEYYCHGAAEWEPEKATFKQYPKTHPSLEGLDYIGIAWGGNGNLRATNDYGVTGNYGNGEYIKFSRSSTLNGRTKGYSWIFDDKIPDDFMYTSARDIDVHANLKRKNNYIFGGKAGVSLIYIHTYDTAENIFKYIEDNFYGAIVEYEVSPTSWGAYCAVDGLEY